MAVFCYLNCSFSQFFERDFLAELYGAQVAVFADEVYLHQVRVLGKDWTVSRYADLPAAMKSADRSRPWLVHYHVPIFTSKLAGGLLAAKKELEKILKMAGASSNFEIETYTFSVLPGKMKKLGVINSMRKEYEWVKKTIFSKD